MASQTSVISNALKRNSNNIKCCVRWNSNVNEFKLAYVTRKSKTTNDQMICWPSDSSRIIVLRLVESVQGSCTGYNASFSGYGALCRCGDSSVTNPCSYLGLADLSVLDVVDCFYGSLWPNFLVNPANMRTVADYPKFFRGVVDSDASNPTLKYGAAVLFKTNKAFYVNTTVSIKCAGYYRYSDSTTGSIETTTSNNVQKIFTYNGYDYWFGATYTYGYSDISSKIKSQAGICFPAIQYTASDNSQVVHYLSSIIWVC